MATQTTVSRYAVVDVSVMLVAVPVAGALVAAAGIGPSFCAETVYTTKHIIHTSIMHSKEHSRECIE